MATWPNSLPSPRQSGYVLRPASQTIRSEMETGPAKVRRISTARDDNVTLSWFMTDVQFLVFRTWFEDGVAGLAGGVKWFTGLPLAVGKGVETSLSCRFNGEYEASWVPGAQSWTVSATVEVL